MAKGVPKLRDNGTVSGYCIWCPGCKRIHIFYTPQWTFNGNLDSPSFTPSLLLYWADPETKVRHSICHSVVKDGKIQFMNDCEHELKGQTLELEDCPVEKV